MVEVIVTIGVVSGAAVEVTVTVCITAGVVQAASNNRALTIRTDNTSRFILYSIPLDSITKKGTSYT
jgi:hypothetical protein